MKNWDTETIIYFAYLLAVVAMISAGLITALIFEYLDKKNRKSKIKRFPGHRNPPSPPKSTTKS